MPLRCLSAFWKNTIDIQKQNGGENHFDLAKAPKILVVVIIFITWPKINGVLLLQRKLERSNISNSQYSAVAAGDEWAMHPVLGAAHP